MKFKINPNENILRNRIKIKSQKFDNIEKHIDVEKLSLITFSTKDNY